MADTFKIQRAERTQARLRLALQGPSGGGKTATSLLIAKGMVAALQARDKLPDHLDGVYIGFLDTERDSAKLYSHLVPFDTLVLEPPYSPARYTAALRALERVGYPIIICDQITHEWFGPGGVLSMVAASREMNDFAKWNGPSQEHDAFIDALLQSPAHLIVTMRSKTSWVLEDKVGKDGKTRKTPTRVGMAAKQRDGTEYEFTTVLDLEVPSNVATCIKDRTELFVVGERYGRLGPDWGERIMDWVYSAKVPELVPAQSPAMIALGVCEAGLRAIEQAPNLPDLATVFDHAQKSLRACSVTAGADAVVPLLNRLVVAKDARKAAFYPPPVHDLEHTELVVDDPVEEQTAVDKFNGLVGKLHQQRNEDGLFATMKDDLPRKDGV